MKKIYYLVLFLLVTTTSSLFSQTAKVSSNSPVCEGDTIKLTAEGGTSYSWKGPNSFTSTAAKVSIPKAVGSYSAYVYSVAVVSGTTTTNLTVSVSVGFKLSNYLYSDVIGSELRLISGYSSISNYSWTGPNSFKSTASNPKLVDFTSTAAGTYALTAKHTNGCISTATTAVTFNNPTCPYRFGLRQYFGTENAPDRSFYPYSSQSTNDINFCKGSKLTFVADTSASTTYQWSKDGVAITGETKQGYTIADNGKYSLVATKGSCTYKTDIMNVTTISTFPASVYNYYDYQSTSAVLCKKGGGVAELDASYNGRYTQTPTYQWYADGQAIKDATSYYYTAKSAGSYTVKVTQAGCESLASPYTITTSDTLKIKLKNDFIAGQKTINLCGSLETELSFSGDYSSTKWYKDGVLFKNYSNYTYASLAGKYTVEVTQGSCKNFSDTITIKNQGTFDFELEPYYYTTCNATVLDMDLDAPYQAYSSGASYSWTKDGSALSGETYSGINVNSAGSYQLKVKNSSSCTGVSFPFKVTKQSARNIYKVLTQNSPSQCEGSGIVLLGKNKSTYTNVNWKKVGSETILSNATTYEAKESGKYYYTYVSYAGCDPYYSDTANVVYTSLAKPIVSDSCIANSVKLSVPLVAGSQYSWLYNGKANGSTGNSFQAKDQGTYALSVRKGLCGSTSNDIIVGFKLSTSAIKACQGDSIKVTAIGAKTYEWSGPNSYKSTAANLLFVRGLSTQSGDYTVKGTSANGCAFLNGVNITIKSLPNEFTSADSTYCPKSLVELKVATDLAVKYQWEKDKKAINGAIAPNLSVTEAGKYRVYVVKEECKSYSRELSVVEKALATAEITGSKSIKYGESANLSVKFTAESPWTIKVNDQEYKADKNPYEIAVSPKETVTYSLKEVKNVCGVGTVKGEAKIEVIILGTEEESGVFLNVFPMPTSSTFQVQVEAETSEQLQLSMTDLTGRVILEKQSANKQRKFTETVDLNNYKTGVYLLQVRLGDKTFYRKVIKSEL
jgi:Secretion system C-terminal sorting domain